MDVIGQCDFQAFTFSKMFCNLQLLTFYEKRSLPLSWMDVFNHESVGSCSVCWVCPTISHMMARFHMCDLACMIIYAFVSLSILLDHYLQPQHILTMECLDVADSHR